MDELKQQACTERGNAGKKGEGFQRVALAQGEKNAEGRF